MSVPSQSVRYVTFYFYIGFHSVAVVCNCIQICGLLIIDNSDSDDFHWIFSVPPY